MNIHDVTIPAAVQLVMDDIGWFWGRNEHELGKPYRTGIPRQHNLADYVVINELGKLINQKINTMFIIGEWDRKGILRDVPYSNYSGSDWTGSSWLDIEDAQKIRDYINDCEYIELGYHGLLHDLWDNDGQKVPGREFFIPSDTEDGPPFRLAPDEIIRKHFDAFCDIYEDWGFNHTLRSFAMPGGPGDSWKSDVLTKTLKDYGIKFWHNNSIRGCTVQSGIILNPKAIEICPWDVYDYDPDEFPDHPTERFGILGSHWANILRYNCKKNCERLPAWKRMFDRISESFGVIISRDIEFAHYQQLHKAYVDMSVQDNYIVFNFDKLDAISPNKQMPFYISLKNSVKPMESVGGTVTFYESKAGFNNYKIERSGESVLRIRV